VQYHVKYCENLATLLPQCDFISIHTPLTKATYHLIGRNELALMKRSAVLVNTARGGIVDTQALYEALVNGVIAAAALDVTEPEPLPADHPLLSLPNVIVTPHIASASNDAIIGMATMAARNIIAAPS
jgi:glyoxylate reductase